MNKKVCFVGGGPASIIPAILLKMNRKDIDVFIIERNQDPLKKLRMTGNGRCNLAPKKDKVDELTYSQPDFIKKVFEKVNLNEYLNYLNDVGIITTLDDEQGYYPYSYSAPNVASILINKCQKLGIKIINDFVLDYQNEAGYTTVIGSKGTYKTDRLFIATGGKSHPETGSKGEMFLTLKKHGYKVNDLIPSLCPIKVKEDIKSLFGVRAFGSVSLLENGKEVIKEKGEIMFKKDALSGICVMNVSRFIDTNKNQKLLLNLLPTIINKPNKETSNQDFLLSIVKEPLMHYVLTKLNLLPDSFLDEESYQRIVSYLSSLTFEVSGLYDFKDSQVTRGGLDINEVDEYFTSKKEKNISFIGELLDVDAICGGYNLRFYITSGIIALKGLI